MTVQFLKVTATQAETKILTALNVALRKYERVLWIVTGGSNIPLVARVMKKVSDADSLKLAILLTDERFGPVESPDSNLQQLYEANFKSRQATVVPVLRSGVSPEDTTKLYAEAAQTAFEAADYSIGLFGMGEDGHIAGILPGSPAVKITKNWAINYEAGKFLRLTLTPFAFSHLSEAIIVVLGNAKKRPALENLQKRLSIDKQPAQLLKKVPYLTVLNDQLGEAA